MNAREAYQITYRLYRRMEREATHAQLKTWINRMHVLEPKAAAAAHTSFSMRSLFTS